MKKKVPKKPAAKKPAARPATKASRQIKKEGEQKKEGARAPSNKDSPSVQGLITKDMGFAEVLQRFPQTFPVFSKYRMHCIGCSMSAFETIEQGAMAHGINVKKFVEDLNAAAGSK